MTQLIFLKMPIFALSMRRLGKKRYSEPALLANWQTTPIHCTARSELICFFAKATGRSLFDSFFYADGRPVRATRKLDGQAFKVSDLIALEELAFQDIIETIGSEPDHPYAPILDPDDKDLPVIRQEDTVDAGELKWMRQLLSVEDEIFVPALEPTLALSLDQERHHLGASVACFPAPSPALRLPTIHLPIDADPLVVTAIARELEVKLLWTGPIPNVTNPAVLPLDWLGRTLADLYVYVRRKAPTTWPEALPLSELRWLYHHKRRLEEHALPDYWLREFLECKPKHFGHLSNYIEGLQKLMIARFIVIGEPLPHGVAKGTAP